MKKPVYDEAFKRQTVQHIKESGQTVAEVARELKINDNTVYGWVKKFGTDPEVVAAQVFKSDEHQMREMQKRIRELQEENEILKKAMHYFAKDRR
ncbi:transposase [Paenibacillus yonginensis]|uniref:Transposase n=1 Tax=Paenibacillus yonginensis TaxID=1462996 RepID=A0A1B1N545_9BACL|nr:transposase [Paenibacillus yonginensis]ANS76560.1 transposase [Paenibacillus yonginensis]